MNQIKSNLLEETLVLLKKFIPIPDKISFECFYWFEHTLCQFYRHSSGWFCQALQSLGVNYTAGFKINLKDAFEYSLCAVTNEQQRKVKLQKGENRATEYRTRNWAHVTLKALYTHINNSHSTSHVPLIYSHKFHQDIVVAPQGKAVSTALSEQ